MPAWQLRHCGNAHIRPFKLLVGGKSFEVTIREIWSRIPIYNRVDGNRTRKRRDQAITTYMKHIRENKDKFPEYIKQH